VALSTTQARSIVLQRCFGDPTAPGCAQLWLNIPRSEQVLRGQERRAYLDRRAARAVLIPARLCPRHAAQHELWGWHDGFSCKACNKPKPKNTTDDCTSQEIESAQPVREQDQ